MVSHGSGHTDSRITENIWKVLQTPVLTSSTQDSESKPRQKKLLLEIGCLPIKPVFIFVT